MSWNTCLVAVKNYLYRQLQGFGFRSRIDQFTQEPSFMLRVYHLSCCFFLGSSDVLTSGSHDWSFVESIPAFCPGSFKGQWGSVQYVAKLTIHRPFGKSDIELVKHFNVRGVLDLNHEFDAKVLFRYCYYFILYFPPDILTPSRFLFLLRAKS